MGLLTANMVNNSKTVAASEAAFEAGTQFGFIVKGDRIALAPMHRATHTWSTIPVEAAQVARSMVVKAYGAAAAATMEANHIEDKAYWNDKFGPRSR